MYDWMKDMQLNSSWKIKMVDFHNITGNKQAINNHPCIHLFQCTPALMRCCKVTKLTSSFNYHPKRSSMRSARPPQPQEEVFPLIFSHGNYSSMFSLSAECLFWLTWWWYDIWGAMSQDCREHIPSYTWQMNAKHVGNVSTAEPNTHLWAAVHLT